MVERTGLSSGEDDGLMRDAPVLERVGDFAELLVGDGDEPAFADLRPAGRIGRPLANKDFIGGLKWVLGRPVAGRAPGRKWPMAERKKDLLLL